MAPRSLDEGVLARVAAPAARRRGGRAAELGDAVLGREGLSDGGPGGAQRGGREATVAGAGLVGPGRLLVEVVLRELGVDGGEAAGDGLFAEDLEPARGCLTLPCVFPI
jgi:hypothetical protein